MAAAVAARQKSRRQAGPGLPGESDGTSPKDVTAAAPAAPLAPGPPAALPGPGASGPGAAVTAGHPGAGRAAGPGAEAGPGAGGGRGGSVGLGFVPAPPQGGTAGGAGRLPGADAAVALADVVAAPRSSERTEAAADASRPPLPTRVPQAQAPIPAEEPIPYEAPDLAVADIAPLADLARSSWAADVADVADVAPSPAPQASVATDASPPGPQGPVTTEATPLASAPASGTAQGGAPPRLPSRVRDEDGPPTRGAGFLPPLGGPATEAPSGTETVAEQRIAFPESGLNGRSSAAPPPSSPPAAPPTVPSPGRDAGRAGGGRRKWLVAGAAAAALAVVAGVGVAAQGDDTDTAAGSTTTASTPTTATTAPVPLTPQEAFAQASTSLTDAGSFAYSGTVRVLDLTAVRPSLWMGTEATVTGEVDLRAGRLHEVAVTPGGEATETVIDGATVWGRRADSAEELPEATYQEVSELSHDEPVAQGAQLLPAWLSLAAGPVPSPLEQAQGQPMFAGTLTAATLGDPSGVSPDSIITVTLDDDGAPVHVDVVAVPDGNRLRLAYDITGIGTVAGIASPADPAAEPEDGPATSETTSTATSSAPPTSVTTATPTSKVTSTTTPPSSPTTPPSTEDGRGHRRP